MVDVDHVRVTNLAAVYDVGHLHARAQFVGLRLHGEDADLAGVQIVDDFGWQIAERARREVFQNPCAIGSANGLQFVNNACGNFLGRFVGDDRDFLVWPHAQADLDGVAGSGSKLWVERNGFKLPVGLTDMNAHYPTFLAEVVTTDSVTPASVSSIM